MEQFLLSEFWFPFVQRIVRILLILIGAGAGFQLTQFLIRRFFVNSGNGRFSLGEKRSKTLAGLVASIFRYAFLFVAIVMILEEFRIDTTSVIASAGVLGLAIGIGAQSIVKDFISGFFIILEDQYAVGDYIISGTAEGTVEEISFRVTKLRDGSGVLHVLPNGGISRVSNFNRGCITSAILVPVAYEADIQRMMEVLRQICREFHQERTDLQAEPTIVGITEFQRGYMTVRILVQSVPMNQTEVEAALRYKIRISLQEQAIPLHWLAGGPDLAGVKANQELSNEASGAVARIEPKPKLDDENLPGELKNIFSGDD
jgi:small conductance mechanosensitive channel